MSHSRRSKSKTNPTRAPARADEADAKHLAMLEAILASAVDAIVTIDEAGTVLSANPAVERMFGYKPEDVIGQDIGRLMPSPFREQHSAYVANYLRTNERKIIGIGREVTGERKDGSHFPIHLAVSEFKIGNRRYFTGIVRDISDLKRAEAHLAEVNAQLEQRVSERTQELRRAQATLIQKEKLATLGELAGGVAHEIRNPLNALKTSAYYLLNAPNITEAKAREHLDRISRQVTTVDGIITALSEVARLPEPQIRRTPIRHALVECIHAIAIPKNVQLVLEIPKDLPSVLADENQIPIVFRNLIVNALEAMPNGGQLTIHANMDQDRQAVTVSVADTGVGIPATVLARIMEPMFSTKANGMGLGLTISRTIVSKNGGQIFVESEAGKGSRFLVTLPIVNDTCN